MPDWSYQPLLRHLPPRVLLRAANALASVPGGGRFIAAFGDTTPPPGFESPVWIVSPDGQGLRALARLGAAGIEVGPVAPEDRVAVERRIAEAGPLPVEVELREAPWTPDRLVREPADALALGPGRLRVDAAALIASGPSLPRRINEAVATTAPALAPGGAPRLLGAGMLFAGVIIWLVAQGPVMLGYDERFVGLTSEQLTAANDRLLPFMAHDRATLAGVMIALGALYTGLALNGLARWEWAALTTSAALGFGSFALFIGYGYFDPLHAALTLLLAPAFVLTIKRRPPRGFAPAPIPDLHDDDAWRRAQRGQLLLVSAALGVIAGGLGIATIGITTVFVGSDLAFLEATRGQLNAIDPQLISLVAHDRAGFGGALASAGAALLLVALRGIKRGDHRLWWTLAAAGLPGFAATILIHANVGYTDFMHLAPVLVAAVLYGGALVCLYPYMKGPLWATATQPLSTTRPPRA